MGLTVRFARLYIKRWCGAGYLREGAAWRRLCVPMSGMRSTFRSFIVALVVATLGAISASATEVRARLGERLERLSEGVESRHRLKVDTEAISDATELAIELPERTVRVARSALERRDQGEYVWVGEDGSDGRVVLTARGGALAGTIFDSTGVYRIFPAADGGHALLEVDGSVEPGLRRRPLDGRRRRRSYYRGGGRAKDRSGSSAPCGRPRDLHAEVARRGGWQAQHAHCGAALRRPDQRGFPQQRDRRSYSGWSARPRSRRPPTRSSTASVWSDGCGGSDQIARLRRDVGAALVGLLHDGGSQACGSAAMIYRPGGPGAGLAFF